MGGKTGGGQPQQQNAMGAGGAGAGMGQPNAMYGGKGGGGAPQNQMGQMPQGQMPQRPDPAMLQQLQAMAQSRGMMGRPGFGGMMGGEKPMMGGINSLQGGPNEMPPPAAATGSSPGGPLSGRFGGWGAQQRGMGWGGGGGMGRFGGFGRNFGGPPPGGGFGGGATPAGMPQGLANLQAMAANQMAPTTGAPLMADQMPQQGYAIGGPVAAPTAAPARVAWSPTGMGFRGSAAPASGTGSGMFPSVQRLGAIAQPAAYVRPAVQQAMWSPAAAAPAASTGMDRAQIMKMINDRTKQPQPGRWGANSR